MKSYQIRQENRQQGLYSIDKANNPESNSAIPPASISNEQAKARSAKKWKTAIAVLALSATAFLIIKLQDYKSPKMIVPVQAKVAVAAVEKAAPAKSTVGKSAPVKKQMDTRQKEMGSPAAFIKAKVKWRKNILGETVLQVGLTNMATAATFKDPVLLITWLSKTNTALETTRYPLYEFLAAGNSMTYKLKIKAPVKFSDLRVNVESAKTVQ